MIRKIINTDFSASVDILSFLKLIVVWAQLCSVSFFFRGLKNMFFRQRQFDTSVSQSEN